MKLLITTAFCLAFLVGCKSSAPKDLDRYTLDYSIGDRQFGVVVAKDDGISSREAQKHALRRAAEIAHEHGYRYFIIDRESDVIMTRSDEGSAQQDMPKNMYYSLIQSDNFGKDRMESSDLHPTQQVTGYQIEFSCQEDKPSSGRYYDVCDYGICD